MKRLLLATVVAIATMSLLGLASAYALRGMALASTPLGFTDPISCLVISIANALGGAIAGRRFIPVALAIMLVSWIASIAMLVQIAAPATGSGALAQVLASNALQLLLSVLAAVAGAALGAWWRDSRAQPAAGPP